MRLNGKIKAAGSFVFSVFACAVLVLGNSNVSATVPYITERMNLTSGGSQTTSGNLHEPPSLSEDGRYVAFATTDSGIVAGDTNGKADVFVRDRKLGTVTRVNLSNSGAQISSYSSYKMSTSGRFILFSSNDSSVVVGDTNGKRDLFLRDLKNNTTEMVSLTSSGGLPNNTTYDFDVSGDGRYVIFTTPSSNIVANDTNGVNDLFVRDRKLGTTVLLSKSDAGVLANAESLTPSISCDGSRVAFISEATNLVSGDVNGHKDLFLIDRIGGDSIANITIGGNNFSHGYAALSCNGNAAVFMSYASNLVSGDTNGLNDMFMYSVTDDTFERVNVDSSGNQANYDAAGFRNGVIDFSGRYIAFSSAASNLVAGDINGVEDVFLRDLEEGTTQIVSKRNSTTQTTAGSNHVSISADGRHFAYESADTGLVTGDTNGLPDIFVSQTGI